MISLNLFSLIQSYFPNGKRTMEKSSTNHGFVHKVCGVYVQKSILHINSFLNNLQFHTKGMVPTTNLSFSLICSLKF